MSMTEVAAYLDAVVSISTAILLMVVAIAAKTYAERLVARIEGIVKPPNKESGQEWRNYRRRAVTVRAMRLTERTQVGVQGGALVPGEAGDYLVEDVDGTRSVVEHDLFKKTYEDSFFNDD